MEAVSDSSDSESEVYERIGSHSNEVLIRIASILQNKRRRVSIKNYVEKVIPSYNEEEFARHFRISSTLFDNLVERFEASATYKALRSDKRFSGEKHMAVFLWFAGREACSFRDLSDRFDMSTSTTSKIIARVTFSISSLCDEAFKLPSDASKAETSANFEKVAQFPIVIGAVDGTHIIIETLSVARDEYVNRKGEFSICLQGICNDNRKFIDVFVGFPGSVHDSRAFRNSFIFPQLRNVCGDFVILGDSAYPCMKHVLTPYRDNGHLPNAQKNYNYKLSCTRVTIEHSFGISKQQFRQLYYCKLRGIEKICHFVRACCVLHNFANENDINFVSEDPVPAIQSNISDEADAGDTSSGKEKRDEICRQLWELKLKEQ